MKKLILIHTLLTLLISVAILGCGQSDQNIISEVSEAGEVHGEDEDHEENTVSLSELQIKTIGLETRELIPMELRNTVQVTGMLELFPEDRAEISPLIGGNVTAIRVIEGDMVKKGQIIAYMQNLEIIQMQQDFQITLSSIDYLKLDYERQERLYKENISSAKIYQAAKAEFLSAKAKLNGLEAKLVMFGLNVAKIKEGNVFPTIPISTPIDGFVHLINVNIGEYADPKMGRKQIMFEITNNARLHAEFRVFEKDIHKVKEGQKVYFTVANESNRIMEATIQSEGKAFENDKKSVHFRASIDNPSGKLLPGMYIEGKIATEKTPVLAVVEDAIVTDNNMSFIFIEIENDNPDETKRMTFEKVQVITGKSDNGYIEIKLFEVLPKGTMIVSKGAYILSSEMIKGELEHDD
jgi:membrane fusion protein, heavy metal efflux system